jgi:hypothetical protein
LFNEYLLKSEQAILVHIANTTLFELLKEGFALIGLIWFAVTLVNIVVLIKRRVRPNPPKFYQ